MFYSPYFITRLQLIGISKLSLTDQRFGAVIKSLHQRKPSMIDSPDALETVHFSKSSCIHFPKTKVIAETEVS